MRTYDARITTWTGAAVDFCHVLEAPIELEDIAHALGMLCRFNGHIRRFYSVAQHSVVVSHLVEPELARAALMHDATEAYMGDMTAPLKRCIPTFRSLEDKLEVAIRAQFDLYVDTGAERAIKAADHCALELEMFCLTNAHTPHYRLLEGGASADVLEATRRRVELEHCGPDNFLPPSAATDLFMDRWRETQ